MVERRCRYCERIFQPSKYQPGQPVCSEADCQRRQPLNQPYWINVEQEGYLRPIPSEFRVRHVSFPEGKSNECNRAGFLCRAGM